MEALDENDTLVYTLQGQLGTVSAWQGTTHQALAFGHSNLTFHVSIITHAMHVITIMKLIMYNNNIVWI